MSGFFPEVFAAGLSDSPYQTSYENQVRPQNIHDTQFNFDRQAHHIFQRTPLTDKFYSRSNVEHIRAVSQDKIARLWYGKEGYQQMKAGGKLEDLMVLSDQQLFEFMYDVYLKSFGEGIMATCGLKTLNKKVISEIVRSGISSLHAQHSYMIRATQQPVDAPDYGYSDRVMNHRRGQNDATPMRDTFFHYPSMSDYKQPHMSWN